MSDVATIWLVDDDQSIRWVIERTLSREGYQTKEFENAEQVLRALKKTQPDLLISDIRMPGQGGLALLDQLQASYSHIPVIIMTAHADLEHAVSAYKGGAYEYLAKPFDVNEVLALVAAGLGNQTPRHTRTTVAEAIAAKSASGMVGQSAKMQTVFRAIGRLAQSDMPVLITGEAGTGKSLIAKTIHEYSSRHDAQFSRLDISAVPQDLLEAELFGFERGAFSGATATNQGLVARAEGGTLFLDEIAMLPLELQTRLSRLVTEGLYYRVGGQRPVEADVRVLAATSSEVDQLIADGVLRADFMHRLDVIRIQAPPLRQRPEDISPLMTAFLSQSATDLGVPEKTISVALAEHLSKLPWPGNVRQLQNVCHWLTAMASNHEAQITDLPETLQDVEDSFIEDAQISWEKGLELALRQRIIQGDVNILHELQAKFETIMITTTLEQTAGRKIEAAEKLGWGRNTLSRKMKDLKIE